ncbi:hypothetical protein DBZ36_10410 [Alginatibacterium sediminis]|uniref:Cation efflux protein transmembrane domain-containing protein n=1 Tax=Alginatibacterium sediminis TaxID=2164068 RepID=A0A420EDQ1_9ALTE|nr:cation transporter [Alginatibacterium sediminis]RKF18796.1 hypothetical protein DBZ36_10410 [Alginatibacterium sediminis]
MNIERKTLLISASLAFVLALWGISMALYTGSGVIMLDGAYNLLSSVMAILGLRIAMLTSEPYNKRYPMGYFAFEPLLVVVKGISILLLVVFAISSNIQTLLDGGREPQVGLMLIYVVPAVICCVLAWFFCQRAFEQKPSSILNAEKQGWLLNAIITGSIGVALVLVMGIQETAFGWVARYVDQVLVIVFSILFLRDPYLLVKNGMKEISLSSPDTELTQDVTHALKNQVSHAEFEVTQTLVMKMGRRWWVTVEVRSIEPHMSVKSYEAFRQELRAMVSTYYDDHFTDVILLDLDSDTA